MSEEKDAMMEFDVIILGTGVKECVLSGFLSSLKIEDKNKKVLVLDRNSYYGGESASLNLDQLYKRFRGADAKVNEKLGKSREYCLDLCPKFLMACGDLVKILLLTKVTDYLEFKQVEGSYVVKDGKVHKCPATPKEALASSLMGMFEKRRFKSFLTFCSDYEAEEPKTHLPSKKGKPVSDMTAHELFKAFSLDDNTQSFTGHAIALFLNDDYLQQPALQLVERTKLYAFSVAKYGKSPYIYPRWGLGGLPEGFSRRCAVHGGTFMLNMNEDPNFIEKIQFHDDGKVKGIRLGEEVSKTYEIPREISCKQLIADPSYFIGDDDLKAKVVKTGQVVRCIAILNQPLDNTHNSDSCQMIIPARTANRKTDIYICVASYHHNIAAQGKYVAVMSANVETSNPEAELASAMALLPAIEEKFVWTSDAYRAAGDGSDDNCFITTSYDATTHFETCSTEIQELYKRVTGVTLDISATVEPPEAC